MANFNGYYDIQSTIDRVEASPRATEYLYQVIEDQSPDSFHWGVREKAEELFLLDQSEKKLLP